MMHGIAGSPRVCCSVPTQRFVLLAAAFVLLGPVEDTRAEQSQDASLNTSITELNRLRAENLRLRSELAELASFREGHGRIAAGGSGRAAPRAQQQVVGGATQPSAEGSSPSRSEYFRISLLDGATGRGVPMVQLRTGNYINLWSDNAGNIAFNEPGMMDQPVFFSVLSDGYNFTGGVPRQPIQGDPRGTDPGIVLTTTRGGISTLFLNRTQIAQRVYRLTGGGRWRDTLLYTTKYP